MNDHAVYTIHLEVRVEHSSGPEPEWENVARAVKGRLTRSAKRNLRMGPDRLSSLYIAEVKIDTAEDLPGGSDGS